MKKIFAAIIFIAMPLMAGAQALKGSYFLDSSLNRHEFNPAFAPRANYFQMLGIGLLLTLIASAFSVLFVMRYDPLKILANRD